VHTLLSTHGLEDFYVCDVTPGRPQREAAVRDERRFAALDDVQVAARFLTRLPGGRSRATFHVPDMHCSSCLWLLERLWRFDTGIGRSEADILTRTVRIDFDPTRTRPRAVAELLASIGYAPVLDAEQRPDAPPSSRRSLYLKMGVAGFAFGNVMLFSIPRYVNGGPLDPAFTRLFGILNLLFAVPVLLYSSADYFTGAWRAVRGRTITLDVPIAIGLAALFVRSAVEITSGIGEGFLDSFAGLVFFLLVGKLFQQRTFERIDFDRSVRSFLPLSVQAGGRHGGSLTPIDDLVPGDIITLRSSEVVPADCTLLDAAARVDYAFVSGEQAPVDVRCGTTIHAGGRIVGTSARLRVDGPVSHSRLARLWANPVFRDRKTTWLTSVLAQFGIWFTVVALGIAAAGALAWWPDARMSVQVATAVLIIACPCAFTLAAPITLGTAMGVLGRSGVYLRQPSVALDLSRVDTVVFDKTGTLTTATTGEAVCEGLSARDWSLVRMLAAESTHPVSRAIGSGVRDDAAIDRLTEEVGRGLTGWIDGHRVVLGSPAFIAAETGQRVPATAGATWASVDDGRPGWIRFTSEERPGVAAAAAAIAGTHEIWLVSGDDNASAPRWRELFGSRMRFGQVADDKLSLVRALQAKGRLVLMIGDGLNDAGALAAADVGLAVSDDTACLVPACDGIVSGARLADLPAILAFGRRARAVVALCFTVSIFYNVIGLGLALAGRLTPLATAILMPVSSLTIVGLSAGLMRRGPRWSAWR
jgi:Cu+-exporting ATPase